jgi:hypothetical protein
MDGCASVTSVGPTLKNTLLQHKQVNSTPTVCARFWPVRLPKVQTQTHCTHCNATHPEDAVELAEPVSHALLAQRQVSKALTTNRRVIQQLDYYAAQLLSFHLDV